MVFNIALGVILCGFLILSRSISDKTISNDLIGSAGFPIIFSVVGLLLLACILVETYVKDKRKEKKHSKVEWDKKGATQAGAIALLLFVYILVVEYLGFIITTFAFIFMSARIMGYKNYKLLILFAFSFTALLIVVFGNVFFVAFPRGVGLLREYSFYLY